MNIRAYISDDYDHLVDLYKTSTEFDFDETTDSEEGINRKIERDPESILLAEENNKIIGSVSIIEDGRIAWLFRLAGSEEAIVALVNKAEGLLKAKGYKNLHSFASNKSEEFIEQRKKLGFTKGKNYAWFWKEL